MDLSLKSHDRKTCKINNRYLTQFRRAPTEYIQKTTKTMAFTLLSLKRGFGWCDVLGRLGGFSGLGGFGGFGWFVF